MTATITTIDRLTVIKQFAAGNDDAFVAAANRHLTAGQIREIATSHGYPDIDKLNWAADILAKKVDEEAASTIPEARHSDSQRTPPPTRTEATTTRTEAPVASTTARSRAGNPFDATAALLLRGKESPNRRTQRLSERISEELAQLRDLIAADEKAELARRAEEEAKAEARADVERLERELAEAKARLAGRTPVKPLRRGSPQSDSAMIRQWARDNNVACPAVGRVPQAVRDAYTSAHTQAAS